MSKYFLKTTLTVVFIFFIGFCFCQNPQNQSGVFITKSDFEKGILDPAYKVLDSDPNGRWVILSVNGSTKKVSSKDTHFWGFRNAKGLVSRCYNQKFIPVIESGLISIYAKKSVPKRNELGQYYWFYKMDWLMISKDLEGEIFLLNSLEAYQNLRLWVEQAKEKDMLVELDYSRVAPREKRNYIYLQMIKNFNQSHSTSPTK